MGPSPARVTPTHPGARDRRGDGRADGVPRGRPLMRRAPLRGLLVLALDAIALLLLAAILPGFDVNGLGGAIVTAAIVGLLNALVWPALSRLALPLSVITLGVAGIALNGAPLALAAAASPGATT